MMEQPAAEPQAQPPTSPQPKMSGLAIAGFIIGIGGLFIGLQFFTGIAAIILSSMAISRINKDSNLTGKGFGITGLILGIIQVLIGIIVIIWLLLVFVFAAVQGNYQ